MAFLLKLLGIDTGDQPTALGNALSAQEMSKTVGFIAIADRTRKTTQIYLHAPGDYGMMGLRDGRGRFFADAGLGWDSYGATWQAYTIAPMEQAWTDEGAAPVAAAEQVIRVRPGRRVMKREAVIA